MPLSSYDILNQATREIPRIRRFFAAKALGAEDVEDLTQEVLLAVVEGASRFRGEASVSTWIYAICRNVYRTHIHRIARSARSVMHVGERPNDRSEEATAVRSIVQGMPAALQSVYILYYEKGLTVRETSRALCRPEGTVKYLLSIFRRKFTEQWQ